MRVFDENPAHDGLVVLKFSDEHYGFVYKEYCKDGEEGYDAYIHPINNYRSLDHNLRESLRWIDQPNDVEYLSGVVTSQYGGYFTLQLTVEVDEHYVRRFKLVRKDSDGYEMVYLYGFEDVMAVLEGEQ